MAWPNIDEVKIIEQVEVSPPPGSVPTTSLPLTFFDIPWLPCPQMQRLYFYEFPHSTHHFLSTVLPTLKHSLSLTLRHFFPLAAAFIRPPSPPDKPYILFTEGDSVSLTIAESPADFHFLAAHHPRPDEALQLLVPNLQPPRGSSERDKTHIRVAGPFLALQVTVFPNSGICIGVRFCHAAADGSAFNHFMRSWALVCKNNGSDDRLTLPSHDRAAIKDPDGLELIFLDNYWQTLASSSCNEVPDPTSHDGYVRATFVVGRERIEKLKRCVNTNDDDDSSSLRISSFVVTCALIWGCLIKSEEEEKSSFTEDEPCLFAFVLDCRDRLENIPIPTTYFGNCLAMFIVEVKRKELVMRENYGIVAAAKAIGKKVGEAMGRGGALKGADKWMAKWREIAEQSQPLLTVAGSSRPGIYEADFGWGRLKRIEMVHIKGPGAIYVAASTEEKGGIEVGLSLSQERMSRFSAILEESFMKLDLK